MSAVLDPERARGLIGRFPGAKVAVAGDLMLDHFLHGRVHRISPEAPVPVVEYERDEYRIGGAANVAHNIHALGGHVRLVGVVGNDEARDRLAAELAQVGIGTEGLVTDDGRPTTRKLRIVTSRHQQVARIDYERDGELTGDPESRVIAAAGDAASTAHAIIVSDYLKGCITRRVISGVLESARAAGIPVLVDPKIPHIDYYAGAFLVTPNHHEAEAATHIRIRSDQDACEAAHAFRTRVRCSNVLITRGEHGMYLLEGNSEVAHVPAVAREVTDVTGAGDTVIATLGLALAVGAPLETAVALANHAAGVVVSRFGSAVLTPDELVAAL